MKVLILCTGNSARSQMAEALFRHLSNGRIDVHSAGVVAAMEVHPLAREAMRIGYGLDLTGQFPKSLDRYVDDRFDYVITVCDHAAEVCPVFPGSPERIHWSTKDPSFAPGDEAARLQAFTRTAAELADRIRRWLDETLPRKSKGKRPRHA
jgi:arsenate reductase